MIPSSTWTPPIIVGFSELASDVQLFAGLGIESVSAPPTKQWTLSRTSEDQRLTLTRPDGVALCMDFTSGKTRHRTTESGMGVQGLSKALGTKNYLKHNGRYPAIVDATGGLGQDAWGLASLGCEVSIYERHPVVHALLSDALQRACSDEQAASIANRVSVKLVDATEALQPHSTEAYAIYLDPMYPSRRKKASSKKGMQFLHELLGPPPAIDSPDLLEAALTSGAARVAVKRPAGAPLLAGSDSFSGQRTEISTPNTRYDIYHCLA